MNQVVLSGYDYDNEEIKAFEDDIFKRKALAERLTNYIDILGNGAVIAIDAQWGDGKTWFARNWHKMLDENKRKTAYIDAFQQDYIEDPFLLIASELTLLLDNDKKILKETAVEVGKALLPTAGKATFKLVVNGLLNKVGVSKEILEEFKDSLSDISNVTSKMIEDQIENYDKEKDAFVEFKKELRKIAEKSEKPVIIFVDELDRCNPVFAVNLIERLKHFFDVPNLVFVLLINKKQLESAVRGVYGADTEADKYLDKFININFNLPRRTSLKKDIDNNIEKYIKEIIKKYTFKQETEEDIDKLHNFTEVFSFLALNNKFSLREIERFVSQYALCEPDELNFGHDFIAYLIFLKIRFPETFKGILGREIKSYSESMLKLSAFASSLENKNINLYHKFIAFKDFFHAYTITSFNLKRDGQIYFSHSVGLEIKQSVNGVIDLHEENLLPFLLRRLDLTELD